MPRSLEAGETTCSDAPAKELLPDAEGPRGRPRAVPRLHTDPAWTEVGPPPPPPSARRSVRSSRRLECARLSPRPGFCGSRQNSGAVCSVDQASPRSAPRGMDRIFSIKRSCSSGPSRAPVCQWGAPRTAAPFQPARSRGPPEVSSWCRGFLGLKTEKRGARRGVSDGHRP